MNSVRICAMSDLHGHLPSPEKIGETDLVLIAGDIVPLNVQRKSKESEEWYRNDFADWVQKLQCDKVIFIAGNHDFWFERINPTKLELINVEIGIADKVVYLEDTSYKYQNIHIYGCPWCTGPFGWAFSPSDTHPDISEHYNNIPDCDILLCHQPPKVGNLGVSYYGTAWKRDFGSDRLMTEICYKNIGNVICGHVHSGEHGGIKTESCKTVFYNVSLKDEEYMINYEPTRLVAQD